MYLFIYLYLYERLNLNNVHNSVIRKCALKISQHSNIYKQVADPAHAHVCLHTFLLV